MREDAPATKIAATRGSGDRVFLEDRYRENCEAIVTCPW
jgi:hypothetical protein